MISRRMRPSRTACSLAASTSMRQLGQKGPSPKANYRPSRRVRWKVQSIPPLGVNVPDAC
jgi:hypothetical protein